MTDQQVEETAKAARSPRTRPPIDRFESPPKVRRVGAHRLVIRPRRIWQYLLAGLVGVALLTGLGIIAVQSIGSGVNEIIEGGRNIGVIQRVEPVIDPEASVAVLNGTETDGLQLEVAEAITEGEWGTIAFADVASATDVEISAVFYGAKDDEAAALGLAKELGGVSTYQSDDYEQYGVQLVVLLGADYAGPKVEGATGSGDTEGSADGSTVEPSTFQNA